MEATTRAKLEALQAGHRVLLNDRELDEIGSEIEIRTAHWRGQVGTITRYVGWIAESATPPDIEFRMLHNGNRVAYASI